MKPVATQDSKCIIIRGQRSEVRGQRLEVRSQKSEVRSQKSIELAGGPGRMIERSKVRSQRPDDTGQAGGHSQSTF